MVLENEAKKDLFPFASLKLYYFFMQQTVRIFVFIWQNREKEDRNERRHLVGCQWNSTLEG
jgi:hypothetical protein